MAHRVIELKEGCAAHNALNTQGYCVWKSEEEAPEEIHSRGGIIALKILILSVLHHGQVVLAPSHA
jgi:hypothetical protein